MYTRSYDEKLGIVIPESYGGTLLREDDAHVGNNDQMEESDVLSNKNPWENERVHNENLAESEPAFSLLGALPFRNFFGDIFKNGKFSLQKIGTEEILIIATAAFLLFSKNGDKECAIMLLLLLFLG